MNRFTVRMLPTEDVPIGDDMAAVVTMHGERGRIAVLRQHEAVTTEGADEIMRAGLAMTAERGGPFDAVLVLPSGVGFEVYEVEREPVTCPRVLSSTNPEAGFNLPSVKDEP